MHTCSVAKNWKMLLMMSVWCLLICLISYAPTCTLSRFSSVTCGLCGCSYLRMFLSFTSSCICLASYAQFLPVMALSSAQKIPSVMLNIMMPVITLQFIYNFINDYIRPLQTRVWFPVQTFWSRWEAYQNYSKFCGEVPMFHFPVGSYLLQ